MKNSPFALLLLTLFSASLFAQNTPDVINHEVLQNPEEIVESATSFTEEEALSPEENLLPENVVDTALEEQMPPAENSGVLKVSDENKNWIDGTRDWLYGKSQGTVIWLDTGIVKPGPDETPVPTPPSRFRIGLYTQIDLEADGAIKFAPVADFDVDVDLPNLESRLKLFVSTKDPTALPGQDAFDSDNGLRVGASRALFENWKSSAGIKTKWPPEPFAYVQWSPEYTLSETWTMVPQLRPFWESQDGFGGLTSVVFNRWNRRLIFRQAFSLKWTQELADDDDKSEVNEESSQFGYNGGGYRWDATTIWGYVPALLDERDYGRRVGGDDVARGYGLKARVTGNEVNTTKATFSLFVKRPAYKDFLYFVIAPEVVWAEDNKWDEEYVLKAGFEMLVWGDPVLK
ncbi:hypothetical protein P0Y35_09335 [Kiritimatiellaeota bacterium B1221]|nr:hypothetical protein [Kiritimatiellaeota bacterium B1221]